MDSVASQAVRVFAEGASRAAEIPLEQLMLDSPLIISEIEKQAQIKWDDFVSLVQWLDQTPYGPFQWEQVGELSMSSSYFSAVTAFAQMTLTVRFAYWLTAKWYGPSQFPGVTGKFEDIGPRHIRQTLTLHPSLKFCPQVFEFFQGAMAIMPKAVFGLPKSVVELKIEGSKAVYDIQTPVEKNIWKKFYFFLRSIFNIRGLLRELALQQQALQNTSSKIQEERSEFKILIDAFADGVVIHRNGIIRYTNPSMAHFLKIENPKDLIGKNIFDFVHNDDLPSVLRRIARFKEDPGFINPSVEFRFQCFQSEEIFVGECTSMTGTFEGEQAVVLTVRDVSERKKLQAHLMLTDRMRALGELAAGVGHEINNPLYYVMMKAEGLSEVLLSKALVSESNLVQDIQLGLGRIQSIVKQLKSISRSDSDAPLTVVKVEDILISAIGMARNTIEHRARLKIEIAKNLPAVRANEARLGQVFLNLLVNAAQAIEPGQAFANVISVKAFRGENDDAVIEVCDTGRGVPQEARRKMFQPFFTTKPVGEGTGLGLSICHSIVTQYGGSIAFRDAPERGALFTVTLPSDHQLPYVDPQKNLEKALKSETLQLAKIAPGNPISQKDLSVKVLLIDDDLELLDVLESVVSQYYQVTALGDAQAALNSIIQGEKYDCIICDLMMPNLGGVDFFERLKEISPAQCDRVVFMTGGSFTARTDEFLRQPKIRSREKPMKTNDLLDLIEEIAHAASN